jgi:mono/diheme cytochrome c family protein
MRNFILGIVVTLAVLILVALGGALLGFFPVNANATPPNLETRLAMSAVDASIDHHAPRTNSPVLPSAENLIDGMKIYTMNCAACHGTLDKKPAPLAHSFYPPPPQFIEDPPDDPDWRNYYVVRNGIRYTGMPAWDKALSDQDIWKVSLFLSHMEKLPAPAQEFWKNSVGVAPPSGEGDREGHGHHSHDHD